MQFAPEPGVHAAHGCAHHQPRMVRAQPVRNQAILRFHHVEVSVMRKLGVHPIARLARFAMPDPVRQHDEKLRRVQRLLSAKEFAGELGPNK